jgi:phosphatidylinositol alpha-1,6-mannosyltransferase
MKILYIATCFDRNEEDVITPWLVETIRHLKARGHDIDVFTSSYRGLRDQVVHGIRVFRFRYFPARWERLTHEETAPDRVRRHPIYLLMAICYVVAGMIGAARVARRGRYDIIHVHWPLPHALMGYAARLACGARLISTFYGVEVTWVRTKLKFLKPFLWWVLRTSDAVTVISTFTRDQVAWAGKANVHIIPFGAGVSMAELQEAPVTKSPVGPGQILFVGRLVERKGIPHLIEAVGKLRGKRDVRATIVGGGPLYGRLRDLTVELGVSDIVSLPGSVPLETLVRLFQDADLFVLPAVVDAMGCSEGLGVVLIEAMSYGKPVVASRVGGIPDVVEDGATGILVTPGSADDLAQAIDELLGDPKRAEAMGTQGFRRARDLFSWDAITTKIDDLYKSVAEGRRA